MKNYSQLLNIDPHMGKPIPGQSLTAAPGSMPYERPPLTADPLEAYRALKVGLYQPKAQREIAQITLAGISCETLASSMVMMAFSQGMFNPDVAEIVKPFLALEIFKIATSLGVDQVILENKPIEKSVNDTDALEELRQQAMPTNKINVQYSPEEQDMIMAAFETEEPQQEAPQDSFVSKPQEVE